MLGAHTAAVVVGEVSHVSDHIQASPGTRAVAARSSGDRHMAGWKKVVSIAHDDAVPSANEAAAAAVALPIPSLQIVGCVAVLG